MGDATQPDQHREEVSMILWTFCRGRVKISMPDGTHSPKFKNAKEANNWLKQKRSKNG